MGDKREELSQYRISSQHLIFSVEGGEEILSVLRAHLGGKKLVGSVRRIGRR
jgi:hypothetical protein